MNEPIKTPTPKGPWDAPLKDYVSSLPMTVAVYDGEELIKEENVDYGNYEHRKFLGRITFWALSNGYIVETSRTEKGD